MNKWFILRIIIILIFSLMSGIEGSSRRFLNYNPESSWMQPLIAFVLSIVFIMILLFLKGNDNRIVLQKPCWQETPFKLREPLNFFELASYICITGGLISLIRVFFIYGILIIPFIIPVSMGIGFLIGIYYILPKIIK